MVIAVLYHQELSISIGPFGAMVDFLKTASVLLLTCLFLFYVKEVVQQYAQGLTTFALKQVDTGSVPLPAMTICFDKLLKPSVLKPSDTDPEFFEVPTLYSSGIPMNASMKNIYEKASYLLGRDWNITVSHMYPSDHNLTLALGKVILN